jgi:rifampicin phosphotransferase
MTTASDGNQERRTDPAPDRPDVWFGDSVLDDRFPAWTRGNAADVFPEPFSPLGQTLVLRGGMSAGLRDGYVALGALDIDEFVDPEHPDLFKVFGGYVYNPLSLTRLLGARMPGATPEMIDAAFFDDRDEVPPYQEQPWHVSSEHETKLGASVEWAMSATALPELDADRELARLQRATRPNLGEATDAALIARARSMVPLIQQTFENAMRVSSMSGLGAGALAAVCESAGDATLAVRLLAGIEVDSAAPTRAMWELGRTARASSVVSAAFDDGVDGLLDQLAAAGSAEADDFLEAFRQFLVDHGARGQNEYDPRAPSWEAAPEIALSAIDLMRRSDHEQAPQRRSIVAVRERDRLASELRDQLAGNPEASGTLDAAMNSAQHFLAGRERAKTNAVIVINEVRMALREFGRRLVERGVLDHIEQVFMVTDGELDALRHHPARLGGVIAERWSRYRALFDLEPVFVVNGRRPTLGEMTDRNAASHRLAGVGDVLSGTAGSGGVATGRARVVLDAGDPTGFQPGDVLVAPQTDPSWVPLFVPAAAVVVDVGALGSHAMIVSRELGIPCVASVADATRRIPDGALVTVDGTAGTVTIVEVSPPTDS